MGEPELSLAKPREGCWMHTSIRGLGLPEFSIGSRPSEQIIPEAFLVQLQLRVGGWPEMRENQNTDAVLTLFSESH